MMDIHFTTRPETEKDRRAIAEVHARAFGREHEAQLVERLRQGLRFVPDLSLVALYRGEVIGHILFYPVDVVNGEKAVESLALAPVAVLPEHQRKGVGSILIRQGLEAAKRLRFNSVTVLGHPEYYPRFGFQPASRWKIKAPFAGAEQALFALELREGVLGHSGGTVQYPGEFEGV